MTSFPIRDQTNDHLLTPKNSALIIIDYQPTQVNSIVSMDRQLLVDNMVRVATTAKIFGLPIVLSTVNVKTGYNLPTIPPLKKVLPEQLELDRTQINAWEDKEFNEAVKATKRKKLVMCALWTEACLTFPGLDALKEGYEVYPVVDAVGGTSIVAHETALLRLAQAGSQNISWAQFACELQRDWNRLATAKEFSEIFTSPNSPLVRDAQQREKITFNEPSTVQAVVK
jgi:nicotinamidase-related amidase